MYLSKIQSFPLVLKPTQALLKPQHHYHKGIASLSLIPYGHIFTKPCVSTKTGTFSSFSSTSSDFIRESEEERGESVVVAVKSRIKLPWIESSYVKEGTKGRRKSGGSRSGVTGGGRSLWGESADKFLKKNEGRLSEEDGERRVSRTGGGVELESVAEENVEGLKWGDSDKPSRSRYSDSKWAKGTGNGTVSRSTWGESADKFLKRNEGEFPVEDRRRVSKTGGVFESVDEEDAEVLGSSRPSRSRYSDLIHSKRSKNGSFGKRSGNANRAVSRSSWGESVDSGRGSGRGNRRGEGMDLVEDERKEHGEFSRWENYDSRGGYRRFDDRNGKPEVQQWNRQESWGNKTWKDDRDSTVPKMEGEGIYGVGPVLAALLAGRREFYALYVQEGLDLSNNNRKKKDKKGFEKVLKIAEKLGVTVKDSSKHDMNMAVDSRPHQGLVLDASPLDMVKIHELDRISVEGGNGPLWVALDEVTDPQNLGAIVRSSYFFGAAGVVLCAKNSAPLSGVVSKASAGSLELMEVRACKNMMQFLSRSAENGWRVLGGSVSPRAVPLNEVSSGAPTILVLGSEGKGLRPLVERSCTDLIRIPGNMSIDISDGTTDDANADNDGACASEELQSFLAVESLNVSVAAGVLLHHLVGNKSSTSSFGSSQANVLE